MVGNELSHIYILIMFYLVDIRADGGFVGSIELIEADLGVCHVFLIPIILVHAIIVCFMSTCDDTHVSCFAD